MTIDQYYNLNSKISHQPPVDQNIEKSSKTSKIDKRNNKQTQNAYKISQSFISVGYQKADAKTQK